jgi:hypothetical protein
MLNIRSNSSSVISANSEPPLIPALRFLGQAFQGATSAPKTRHQRSLTYLTPAPNTKLLDKETGRGSKTGEQAYPMYGKKERSY